MNKLKLILAALTLSELVFSDKNVTTLSKEHVDALKAAFKNTTGQDLSLTDLMFDNDGFAEFSRASLENINAIMADFGTQNNANATNNDNVVSNTIQSLAQDRINQLSARIAQLEASLATERQNNAQAQRTIETLGRQSEQTPPVPNPTSDFRPNATGYNSPKDFRFWNQAALLIAQGNRAQANILTASSAIDIEKINEELGNYFRERYPEIQDFVIKTPSLDSIFPPYSTGIKDELVVEDMFTSEFLQPYNPEWAEKGGYEFQPEIIKVRDFKVDHRFKATELRSLITSWLAPMTKGTDPFQESFVAFLIKKMTEKIIEEKTQAMVRGVYRQSPNGVAGPAIEAINGLLKTIQTIRESYRIKPFNFGKWNLSLKSHNHIYKVIYKMYMAIPQTLRDSKPVMNVYTSIDGANGFKAYQDALGKNTDFEEANIEQVPDNVKVIGVPFYASKVLIMTIPDLIKQFYREKDEDNRFNTQKEKRDTIIFMDGAAGIYPIKSGYQYEDAKSQTFDNQIIFLSNEFDDYTYIKVDPDLTILDAKTHNCMMISQNSKPVTITQIKNVKPGQIVYLLGESETGKESTLKTTATIILTSGDWISAKGNKLTLVENSGKLIEIERHNVSENDTLNAEILENSATPTLSPNNDTYLTAVDGSAVTITDFLEAIPGKSYTIKSSHGTVVTTIAANSKFVLAGATWKSDTDNLIKFYYSSSSGKFIETDRG